tara:strand:+ start:644 stop:883 length:240 start_codon:yes stop_codon:yes gene_type:complete
MRFKVGDLIVHKEGGAADGDIDIEAIIVRHWETESPWKAETMDNVELYFTFDGTWSPHLGRIEPMLNFQAQFWTLKNEV